MRTIRILLFCLAALLPLAGCGIANQSSSAEKEAERQSIVQAVESGDFVLQVTEIIPQGFPVKSSNMEYELRLKDGVVTTRLPFIGRSYDAGYPGKELSIVFEKEKVVLKKDFSEAAKGKYRYYFQGGKDDTWTVSLLLWDSGKADIDCASQTGRFMSYRANIVPGAQYDEKN